MCDWKGFGKCQLLFADATFFPEKAHLESSTRTWLLLSFVQFVFLFMLTFFLFLVLALSWVICSPACSAPNPGTGSTGHPPPSAGWES